MWELKIEVTMTSELEDGTWSENETVADLKTRIDHTATDEDGEYLPDDEVTADRVAEEVQKWQERTGLVDNETTMYGYNYNPEKAKKVK